jgi:hypothetical protein
LEPSISCGDDFVGTGLPDERLCFGLVVFSNKTVDGGFQIIYGFEHTMFQPPSGEFGEEAFHYRRAMTLYLANWRRKPPAEITRQMVLKLSELAAPSSPYAATARACLEANGLSAFVKRPEAANIAA